MKEITRKVVKEVEETVWEATDGKIFEDEDECYEYEALLLLSDIPCWDYKMRPCKDLENVMYVYLKDIVATDKFLKTNKLMDSYCYGIDVGDVGWFEYNGNVDMWTCCNNVIELYENYKGEKNDHIHTGQNGDY